MATTDLDDIPWPPDRDDPRIERLEAELAAEQAAHAETRIENEQLHARDRERCRELARLQAECPPEVLERVYGESSNLPPDRRLIGPQANVDGKAVLSPIQRDERREVLRGHQPGAGRGRTRPR
jgi:hypothetical protein